MGIKNFIDRMSINKGCAESTILSYTRILNTFDSYLKTLTLGKRGLENTDLLTVRDVEQYIATEKIRGLSARTCNGYLICIRDFLAYARRNGENVIDHKQIVLMKERRKKIDALSENEAQKLLMYMRCDRSKDDLTKTRDLAIVTVLLHSGLRVSELCNIKVEDIRRELQIIGKNQTLRLVYLFQDTLDIIRLYLYLREGKHIESEYLFCSHATNTKGHKLTRTAVEMIVKTAGINAGISNPVWPHKLRHTFATSILRRGGNIYYIKELLGHASIQTTQTYLSATNRDLRETQKLLLKNGRGVEGLEEELEPIPESYVIKDPILIDEFRSRMPSFQQEFRRGVPTQFGYNYGLNF